MDEPVKSFKERFRFRLTGRTEWKIFMWCLLLSIMLWFLTALNETYPNVNLKMKVKYTNVPKDKVYSEPLPKDLTMLVNAVGWDLLRYRIQGDSQEINIDLEHYKGKPYIISSKLKGLLGLQLTKTMSINDIYPDTIDLTQENMMSKRVPVQLQLLLSFEKEYGLGGPVIVRPDSVTINGPISAVERVHSILTEDIKLYKLNHPVKKVVKLDAPENLNLTYTVSQVEVSIPTFQLTESTIEVPVEIINKTSKMNVNLFPRKVKITFQTPINKYEQMTPDLFQAIVDGNMIDTLNNEPLKVQLITQPDFAYNVRIEPEFVSFVITK